MCEFFVRVYKGDKEGVARIYKDGSKWYEENLEGDLLGDKTYMGYLSKPDIMMWLNSDFDYVEEIGYEDISY